VNTSQIHKRRELNCVSKLFEIFAKLHLIERCHVQVFNVTNDMSKMFLKTYHFKNSSSFVMVDFIICNLNKLKERKDLHSRSLY